MVACLSEKTSAGLETLMWKSCNSCCIQSNSMVVVANTRYSASAEDLAKLDSFLAFQETRKSPKNTQKPMTDLLESGLDSQSAFENARSCIEDEEVKNKP